MKAVNIGGHSAYQNHVLKQLRKYYPDAADSLPASTWEIMEKFWSLDLSDPALFTIFSPDCGFLMMITSRPKSIPQRKNPEARQKRGEGAACRKAYRQGTLRKV